MKLKTTGAIGTVILEYEGLYTGGMYIRSDFKAHFFCILLLRERERERERERKRPFILP